MGRSRLDPLERNRWRFAGRMTRRISLLHMHDFAQIPLGEVR